MKLLFSYFLFVTIFILPSVSYPQQQNGKGKEKNGKKEEKRE